MRPAVVADFMTFARCSSDNVRIFSCILPDNEEGGFDVMLGQQVQQLRGELFLRSIVECQCDEWSVDVNIAKGDVGCCRRRDRGGSTGTAGWRFILRHGG